MRKLFTYNPRVQLLLAIISFCCIHSAFAQGRAEDIPANEVFCPNRYYQRSPYPEKLVQPYVDILFGFSTFKFADISAPEIGPMFEVRGGIQLKRNLLLGTGISVNAFNGYETGVVIPFELGYRTNNQRFDLMSSVGYSYLLFYNAFGTAEATAEGRTIALDAYWRPTFTCKQMRFVFAIGGMMYDFGNVNLYRDSTLGPNYTFRLRAGVGF